MVVDETETQVDETSPEKEETSQESRVDSQEQVISKLMEKIRSDTLAELGRVRKAAEDAIKRATSESKLVAQQLLEQREREDLEAAKDEPDKQAVIRERMARRQKESELAETQTKLTEANAKLQELSTKEVETTRERSTKEIAERLKVNPTRLAELVKFTNGSAEAIEEIAKEMPKLTSQPKNPIRPDSSETAGGTAKTKTQIQQDYIGGKINTVQYAEKMKASGFTP